LEPLTEKLKLVTDAPSILTVFDAVTQAQAIIAGYTDPASGARDADATLRKLADILDHSEANTTNPRTRTSRQCPNWPR
jgi:hypothetical protein